MLRDKCLIAAGLIFVCTSLLGLSSCEAKQISNRLQNFRSSDRAKETKPLEVERTFSQIVAPSLRTSSRRNPIAPSVKLDDALSLSGGKQDKTESAAQPTVKVPTNSKVVAPTDYPSVTPVVSNALPVVTNPQPLTRVPASPVNYSFQRDGFPTLEQRREIRSTPIELRPYRPFHFYGNTVRRSGRK